MENEVSKRFQSFQNKPDPFVNPTTFILCSKWPLLQRRFYCAEPVGRSDNPEGQV